MSRVRGILCDLDGVVYRAHQPCPGAVDGLAEARSAGVRVLFMTNNASRPPEQVAEQLTSLGVPATAHDVLTASQVAADVLARERPDLLEQGRVLAVGGAGVAQALREAGLDPCTSEEARELAVAGRAAEIGAVVQGYGPAVGVPELSEAAYRIRDGATWIATNDDATLPTERGLAPGNGSLVAALRHATGATPTVTGKPWAPAYEVALSRLEVPAEQALMVGDRLDTDIAGARAVGVRSALVLTGVSTREEAAHAAPEQAPDEIVDTIPRPAAPVER